MCFPLSKADLDVKPDDGNSQDKDPPALLGEEVNMQHMITGRNNDISVKTHQCLFCLMQSSDSLLQALSHCFFAYVKKLLCQHDCNCQTLLPLLET